jgi:hypothetical protein
LVAGPPPGRHGQKKIESPIRRRRGPEKIPVRVVQRTRNLFGSPAQGGLNGKAAKHGGAIEDAHNDAPKKSIQIALSALLIERTHGR